MKKGLMIFILAFFLIGCSKEEGFDVELKVEIDDDVTIKQLKYDTNKMLNTFNGFNNDLEDGVYMFNTSEDTSYLFFQAREYTYSDMTFEIEGETFIISYKSEQKKDSGANSLFKVETHNQNRYDTIHMVNNDNSDTINSIFIGDTK